jgi:NhaP-type Na+/H+ or K+/H+ antiporter
MKMVERKSQWHHVVFSMALCLAMALLLYIRKDISTFVIVGVVLLYIAGNTLLHVRRHDFRSETLYEYLLVAAAVLLVLLSALRQ